MYAQLMHQNFRPDKRAGWDIPNPTSKNFKSYDLGVKLVINIMKQVIAVRHVFFHCRHMVLKFYVFELTLKNASQYQRYQKRMKGGQNLRAY